MTSTSTDLQAGDKSDPSSQDAFAALAEMTGYHDENSKPKQTEEFSAVTDGELLDETDLDDLDGLSVNTKTPLWSNPFAKTLFVGTLMALGFGLLGLFMATMNRTSTTPEVAATASDNSNPMESAEAQQQAEIGRLKTTAALGSQMETLNQNSMNTGARIRPQQQPAASPSPTAETVAVRPQPVPISPPRSSYSPPVRSYSQPAPRSTSSSSSGGRGYSQPPAVDPHQAWQTAQSLGSYGQTSEAVSFNPETSPEMPSSPASPEPSDSLASEQSQYNSDAAALLSGVPQRSISISPGATAKAELATPVIWAQDMDASEQPQRFNIQLSEPIYDQNGNIAFPAATKLVASVGSVSESGLLVLNVGNAIVPTSSGDQVVAIPDDAIQVSSDGGKPLIARDYRSGGNQTIGRDITTVLFGALANVGSLLNRPSNQTTTSSPFLSSTSVSNNNPNVVGGILEGGFTALQSSLSQRQQSQAQAVLSRPHIWYIPQGKAVQVFVNRQIESQL